MDLLFNFVFGSGFMFIIVIALIAVFFLTLYLWACGLVPLPQVLMSVFSP